MQLCEKCRSVEKYAAMRKVEDEDEDKDKDINEVKDIDRNKDKAIDKV